MIFSDSPSQKALERMMTQVKGFPPRGSGVMVLRRFEYTAEMCDCRLCLYYNRKKKCTVSQCPCIEERIVAGAAGRSEVMAETMKDIHNAAFRKRLIQFIRESEELPMNFRNEKHRFNDLETINPELASEWHPVKNGSLTASSVSPKSSKKVWWLGKCGHEWQATVNDRANGTGCPICRRAKNA